ncbi:MAG: thioester domain-containing protein, partial [Eubacteriales bacterium]|nr:thioester domain-containing protein [Eubacteriales bacterium]
MSKIEYVAASIQNKADMPPTRPFIINEGTDISGTASGNPSVESYCALDTTENSRYRLNRDDHNQIFQFFLTAQGSTRMAYCLDKFADGPYGDIPYQSTSFETLFPTATARQKKMLAWIMANTFPTVSAGQTFSLAGVDSQESPVLDDNDAYAAVQVALWVLLGQISPSEVEFLDCTSGTDHPKSQRMRAAVLRLLQLAGSYADESSGASPAAFSSSRKNCCTQDVLQCCNKGVIPGDPSTPYIIFDGCPDEVRTICGRLLIGPFRLLSSFTGIPSITVEPLCSCEDGFSASFADFCGNTIASPAIGEEFYVVVRAVRRFICFQVNASITGNVTNVVTMEPNAQNYQPIGATFEDENTTVTASVCLCAAVPEIPAGGNHSCQSILINNNSQTNNTNNTNN